MKDKESSTQLQRIFKLKNHLFLFILMSPKINGSSACGLVKVGSNSLILQDRKIGPKLYTDIALGFCQ